MKETVENQGLDKMKLIDLKKVYFIGIGGIGMSAIARYFQSLGIDIHGYDKTKTKLTEELEKSGMKIHYQESLKLIPEQIDLVVFTPAIPEENIELKYLLKTKIPVEKRAKVLGWISQEKKTIAIAGTHGKTSTSSIVTHLLKEGGVDCTAFLGGIANNYQSNYVQGHSDWIVVEADEYDRSFLHLNPNIASIMSTDADHLDIYGSHEAMKSSGFEAFAKKLSKDGTLFLKADEQLNLDDSVRVEKFGLEKGKHRAKNVRVEDGMFCFDFVNEEREIKDLKFTLPGKHNIENATVAIAIALMLGVEQADIRKALLNFKGIRRRFEMVFRNQDAALIDDYAHHPTELNAAIGAAKQLFEGKKITGIFQPHLFSRTKDFAEGFAEALDKLDEIILLPIYPAREKPMLGVSSEMIFNKMKNENKTIIEKEKVVRLLSRMKNEVILILGAGDIDTIVNKVKKYMEIKF